MAKRPRKKLISSRHVRTTRTDRPKVNYKKYWDSPFWDSLKKKDKNNDRGRKAKPSKRQNRKQPTVRASH